MVRPLLSAFVLLGLGAVACGKSRLAGESSGRWEEPTAANGFHGDTDTACAHACVPKSEPEPDRPKHAVRTNPQARVAAYSMEPSRAGLVYSEPCLVGAVTDGESGHTWCVEPRDGTTRRLGEHGPPSAMFAADRLYVATRDANGQSTIRSGDVMVSVGENDVRALAAHGNEVCWIDANERVRCARDAAPSSVHTVAHAPAIDARFLAMDDGAFYVVRGGWIARLGRSESSLETLAMVGSPVRDLVIANGYLYWTEQGEPRIECNPDGTTPSCSARGRFIRYPFGTLRRVRIADQRPSILAKDLDTADGILLLKEQVYVSTREGLVRVPLDGSSATVLPTGDPSFGRPALDPVSWTVYVQTRNKAEPARIVAIEP